MAKGRRGGRNKNKSKSNDSETPNASGDKPSLNTEAAQRPPKKKTVTKTNEEVSVTMKHRSQSFRTQPDSTVSSTNSGTGVLSSKNAKNLSSLQERMRAKLEGAKFRKLNEELYTTTGNEAFETFSKDPTLFDIYHRGYRKQVEKWPENPLTLIINWLKERYPESVVADFGCGDAMLALNAPKKCKVHSFDLVSVNDRVIACDMAHVPLESNTVDVAVFCLSLMGTNLIDYLHEAKRVLKKPTGILKIAEVRSRIDGMEGGMAAFIAQVCKLGFKCLHKDKRNKFFLLFEFALKDPSVKSHQGEEETSDAKVTKKKKKNKNVNENQHGDVPDFIVPPCIYKRR